MPGELVEFRSLRFLGEQQRLFGQDGDWDAFKLGEPVTGWHQNPERVLTEQQGMPDRPVPPVTAR